MAAEPLPLLSTLCAPGEARARTAAGHALCSLLVQPAHRHFAQQHLPLMLQRLEPLLSDVEPAVRKQAPVVLGAVGAAQQPELRGFFAWVSDAAQRMGSASGKEGQLGWGLLLASARECVDALCRTDSVECAASGVPGLIG